MFPPHARLQRIADAAAEPITIAQAKRYLRIESEDTGDDSDDEIGDLIAAARLECESINDRSFISTRWRLTLDYLPFSSFGGILGPAIAGFPSWIAADDDGSIVLPKPPLLSVESISYVDQAGTLRQLDVSPEAGEVLVSTGTPGRIAPGYNKFFPFSRPTIAAVNVEFTAGYGSTAADVPKTVGMAMRLLVAHYYEHRTANVEVPDAVRNLLNVTRWGGYA